MKCTVARLYMFSSVKYFAVIAHYYGNHSDKFIEINEQAEERVAAASRDAQANIEHVLQQVRDEIEQRVRTGMNLIIVIFLNIYLIVLNSL